MAPGKTESLPLQCLHAAEACQPPPPRVSDAQLVGQCAWPVDPSSNCQYREARAIGPLPVAGLMPGGAGGAVAAAEVVQC